VLDAQDVDLVDVLEAPAGGRAAEPFALVSAGAFEVADDFLGLGDDVEDVHAEVWE